MIIGNWKMNTARADAVALAEAVANIEHQASTRVGICPPALWIDPIAHILEGSSILLGAQDCIGDQFGAQTGCINADMAHDAGCAMAILGHSERRARFGETSASLLPAVAAVLETGMFPVFCVGETQEERESGRALDVVADQIRPLLTAGLDLGGIVIAYEPVWAIGTGLSATRADIEEMHATVRDVLARTDALVLYGGSVSPESADEVFSAEGVSGALVGGASLNADKFAAIVAAWERK
ncbi:MAG: triose-phosphate isomerase [Gammaproteobacteria bacterium]|jgi:triosephosphate isomerase|nr:triose-phosphate isomerase [Gammaproteobacteria bacterium]